LNILSHIKEAVLIQTKMEREQSACYSFAVVAPIQWRKKAILAAPFHAWNYHRIHPRYLLPFQMDVFSFERGET
jgi:hypothetical protein